MIKHYITEVEKQNKFSEKKNNIFNVKAITFFLYVRKYEGKIQLVIWGIAEYKKWALNSVELPSETIVKDNIYWSGIHYR